MKMVLPSHSAEEKKMKETLNSTEEKKVQKPLHSVMKKKNMKKTKESSHISDGVDDDMREVAEILVALPHLIAKRVAAFPCSPVPNAWGSRKLRFQKRERNAESIPVHQYSNHTKSQTMELTEEMMKMVLLVRENEEKLKQKDIQDSQYKILKHSAYQMLNELETKLEQLSPWETPKKTDLDLESSPRPVKAASEGEENQETVMERLASSFETSVSSISSEPNERSSGLNPLEIIDFKMSNHTGVVRLPDLNLPAAAEETEVSVGKDFLPPSVAASKSISVVNAVQRKLIFKMKKQP